MSLLRARKGPRTLLGLLAAMGLVAALAMPALASHVTPTPISVGNPTCADFDSSWTEFKLQDNTNEGGPNQLQNGTYTDGTLTVTLSNFADNQFDWESNIGVDAVFVKAGNDMHNLYEYDPEATEDDGLTAQAGQGNGISHISFCYDADAPESEAPPSEPAESTPASEAPPSEPVEESEAPAESEAAPSESQREGELGGTPTPAPSGDLPDTAFGGDFGQMPATVLSLVLIGALAAMVYVRLARQR